MSSCVQLVPTLETTPEGIDATPVNGTFAHCRTVPIGIEPQSFTEVLGSPAVVESVATLKEQWGERKIILGTRCPLAVV